MMIPDGYIEIERIYAAMMAGNVRSLAVTASQPQEGVSTVIRALARRNLNAGRSTLLVDLNLHSPHLSNALALPSSSTPEQGLSKPHMLSLHKEIKMAVITAPARREVIMQLREPGMLANHIQGWLKNYDTVLLDTSPIGLHNSGNLPGEYAASACDACILTVLAGVTSQASIKSTIEKLNKAQALLLGTVINDRYNPGLKQELLREADKLSRYFPGFANRVKNWLNKSHLLSLEL
ncbi:hypothetical protein [Thalassomonas actiniarum]|uniref:Protein SypD n=1 Tax=Thalassomonas actiniarum TaxID=485447 RepID=A0AAE9YNW7_9GAMM|nr:hypothetical protein [Thalassomonas actiniarum]WDD96836.1 protein SypD [Thalassomonas actiniarum]